MDEVLVTFSLDKDSLLRSVNLSVCLHIQWDWSGIIFVTKQCS